MTQLKTTFRILLRNKLTSLIHIAGLAIGISAALIIYLIVDYDFGFDHFHTHADRIYRVVTDQKISGDPYFYPSVPGSLPQALDSAATGIEASCEFYQYSPDVISVPGAGANSHFKQDEAADPTSIFADQHYFSMFSYHWLAGDPHTALTEPATVVLTRKMASIYYPHLKPEDIIGKSLVFDDSVPAKITGIVDDLTQPSDLIFTTFISWLTLEHQLPTVRFSSWGAINSADQFFIRLTPGTSVKHIQTILDTLRSQRSSFKNTADDEVFHHLQPLSDLHFNAQYGTYTERVANKTTLYCLLAVGLFLLTLACINYINLSTAQATRRAKEIGVRKTLGADQAGLMARFLRETLLLTTMAALLACLLANPLLKSFSDFVPAAISFNPFKQPMVLLFLLILITAVTLLAGFYPALILSGMKPVWVLKGLNGKASHKKAFLRQSLTVLQFVIAQVFILGTLLVSKQIYYALHKDLGYRTTNIVSFLASHGSSHHTETNKAFLAQLTSLPGVSNASMGSGAPASLYYNSGSIEFKDGPVPITTNVMDKAADSNYVHVYGLKIVAGRNLVSSDSTTEYMINETYARNLGYKDARQIIGKHLGKIPIVGVVGDFYPFSLRSPIKPIAINNDGSNSWWIHVLLRPESPDGQDWTHTLSAIEKMYKTYFPKQDFKYQFYDKQIANFYTTEIKTAQLLTWATGLAILISCMGLLGLVLFTIEVRTKEIGIRKVLGASVTRIVRILSEDFLKLVGIAFVIAIPLAWWGAHQWLNNYADRTPMSWWVFALGGIIILGTAVITLGLQTLRAARANPADSLRSE